VSPAQLRATAEDARKLGDGLMLAGIIGSTFRDQVAVSGGTFGLILVGLGGLITPKEHGCPNG
jgi:hypothetical protein